MAVAPRFKRSVFINCPFDSDYAPIMEALLFCIVWVGLEPRISTATLNSGDARISKIFGLIQESRFAIHDLSRLKASRKGEFYRMNMPFELGLDIGCRQYGAARHRTKKCLILEAEHYPYKAALSDLSNSDIKTHGNEPVRAVREASLWLMHEANLADVGPAHIWARYQDFNADYYDRKTKAGYSPDDIRSVNIGQFIRDIRRWCRANGGLRPPVASRKAKRPR